MFLQGNPAGSQPPQPLLTVMRGFNLFTKPLPFSKGRGLKKEIAENRRFPFPFGIAGHAISFLCYRATALGSIWSCRVSRYAMSSHAAALKCWDASGHTEDARSIIVSLDWFRSFRWAIIYLSEPSSTSMSPFSRGGDSGDVGKKRFTRRAKALWILPKLWWRGSSLGINEAPSLERERGLG